HALAAARLQPASGDRRLLAITLLGNRKHLFIVISRHWTNRHDIIVRAQIYAANSTGRSAHRPDVLLVETDCQSIMGGYEDPFGSIGRHYVEQFVALVNVDGDNPVGPDVLEFSPRGLLDYSLTGNHNHVFSFD